MNMLSSLCLLLIISSSSKTQETESPSEEWEPYFGEAISNVTVALGREAVLACTVHNIGHFKVGWLRAEDQTVLSLDTRVVTHNARVSVTHDPDRGVWRLHIRQLRHSDRGCYMCQINTARMKKQLGCLDVHVPPDIVDAESSSDMRVTEGANVTLSCRARGHPQPRIVWRREDSAGIVAYNTHSGYTTVDSYSGDTLRLLKVDYKQMGPYLCIASNDIPPAVSKRIVLLINFAPICLSPSERTEGAALGSNVSLSCIFHGYPNQNASWHREIGRIHEYGGDYTVSVKRSGYEVLLELTIRNIRPLDLGRYFCCLSNGRGTARATFQLVEVQPETTTAVTTHRTTASTSHPPTIRTSRPTPFRTRTTPDPLEEDYIIRPTFNGDHNDISELAVEAERRRGGVGRLDSPAWLPSLLLLAPILAHR